MKANTLCAVAAAAVSLGLGACSASSATEGPVETAATHSLHADSLQTQGADAKLTPDFAGMWYPDESVSGPVGPSDPQFGSQDRWRSFKGFSTNGNTPPPLKPEFVPVHQAEQAARRADMAAGILYEEERKCRAPLFFNFYSNMDLWDIFQRDDELVMINTRQRAMPRHIMIGREQPPLEDVTFTSNGNSVAHWEGDVLVIDTIGMTDDTWLLRRDWLQHSDKLHIVERLSLSPDGDVIINRITLTDPEILSEPWDLTFKFRRAPADAQPLQEECNVDEQVE